VNSQQKATKSKFQKLEVERIRGCLILVDAVNGVHEK